MARSTKSVAAKARKTKREAKEKAKLNEAADPSVAPADPPHEWRPTDGPAKLSIAWIPLEDLSSKLLLDNAKNHALAGIEQSILRYGFRDAIILDERFDVVLSGHGRLEALVNLKGRGFAPPLGIRATDEDWLIPVQVGVAAESMEAAKAFSVDHNNSTLSGVHSRETTRLSMWDSILLDKFLEGVQDSPITFPSLIAAGQSLNGADPGAVLTPFSLQIGNIRVPMTRQERARLEELALAHIGVEGTYFGFMGGLIGSL